MSEHIAERDPPCTDCYDTGYNPNTERQCTCDAAANIERTNMTDKQLADRQSPLERAARALCEASDRDPDALEPGNVPCIDAWLHGEEHHFVWRHYVDDAKAVLMAIREPSEAMVYAGVDYRPVNPEARAKDCWVAMIDAALKDNSHDK